MIKINIFNHWVRLFSILLLSFISICCFAQTAAIIAVSDSGNDGNVALNTIDKNLATRWSSKGIGQWISYDLGTTQHIQGLSIAFFKGDQRYADIVVETSSDANAWQAVWSGAQPQLTTDLQSLEIDDSNARYLRITGYGNSSNNNWNSITEVSISASFLDGPIAPAGEGWTYCSQEGQQCTFNGTHEVAYGVDTSWNFATHTNSVSCSNAVFGDPISGKTKYCWTRPTAAAPPGIVPPSGAGWIYCAREQAQCEFAGTREVAYGRDSSWNYAPKTDGVTCNNAVFGDPIGGRTKYCWFRSISVTINVSSPQQLINLMGGDMERSAGFLDNATNSQQIADWHYKDINFAHSRVSFDRQQELVEGVPNMAFYNNAISAMKKVKNARSDVQFWATMKSDYDGFGTTNNLPDWVYTGGGYNGGSYDPTKLNTTKYARFLADYLKHMNDNGVPIGYLSVSKEWTQVFDATRERNTINALKQLLATSTYLGVPVPKFFAPSTWGVGGATSFVNSAINIGSLSLYQGIGTHSYDNPSEASWNNLINIANVQGKSLWHTESSSGAGGRYSGGEPPINSAIQSYLDRCGWYRQGLQGEMFFENWSRGVAAETRGVYFTNGSAGVRKRGYYIMKQFANNAVEGRYISTSRSGLTGADTMAFIRGKKLILWIINSTTNTINDVNFTVSGASLSNASINRLAWYNGSATSGYATTLNRTNGVSFINGVGPMSLVSYVFDIN